MRRQSSTDRFGRLAMLVVVTLVLILPISTVSSAGTFTFPVQSEQPITGTTTGLGGAQTDDGVLETLRENDTAPDSVTAPATQTLTTGTMVGGTFPGDVSSEDGVFVQYREAAAGIDAIAFDSATSFAQDAAASSFSFSHTTSGSNRVLIVGVSIRNDLSQSVSTVTYAGSPLTFLRADTNGVSVRSELWYRVAPATGANTVVVTLSVSAKAAMGAISLTGVDQSTPIDANAGATGSGTAPSVSVTTVTNNAWVVDAAAFRSTANAEPTGTSGSGQTQRWSGYTESGGVSVNVRGKGSTEGPKNSPGGVVMDWSLSASVDWAISAASFRPGVEAEIAYRSNTGANTFSSPKTRTGDGSTWSAEAEQATAGSPIRAVRMAWSPIAPTTRIIVTQSDDGWLDAYVCAPSCTVTNNIGQVWSTAPTTSEMRFDIAYEYLSGDALLVYGVLSADTTRDIAFRTYVSGSWGAEQYLDDTGHGTDVQYSLIKLASRRGSDQIGLIGGDDTNNDVNAWIWDGNAGGSFTEITASAQSPNREEVAIAWESNSGHLLAVAALVSDIVSKEYTTSWSSAVTFTFVENNLQRLSLKPNPVGDDMIIAMGEDNDQFETNYWTGSAWANNVVHDGDPLGTGRAFDFAWEATGSNGLLVWSDTAGQISYKTFTAPNTWGSQTNPAMGSNGHPWVQLRTNPFAGAGAPKILGAVMETTANDLGAIRWDGAIFTVVGASTFSADIGVNAQNESFELEYQTLRDDQLLVRYDWTGVPAGDSYTLQVKGYRQDENINVQVLTPPSAWATRITVNSLTNQLFTIGLTLSEYNAGTPQVRFVDAVPQDGSLSDLFLDWVAVTTVRLTHSLEVRQNVTGIMTGSNPILVVKGNITSGGENFHIYVWNFTSASWNLLMAAPFTPTNAYHNASLAADHVSGGTVRVRFVDAASQDATRWALSLDFVAVVITNDQATLTNAGVSPASGYITTSFTFFVRYSDPENNAPAFVNLTLDGISYAVVENNSADTNYVDGKDYFLNRVIGIRGTFNYSFSARASAGDLTLAATPVRQLSVLNRAPSITNPITSDTVHTGRAYVRDFNGTDPDGDTLAWSASTNASWLSIGSANGTVWGAAPSTVGVFYVDVSAVDGFGGLVSNNYTLSVGNLAPSISNPITSDAVHTGRSYVRDFNGTDPDGDTVVWSLATSASWLFIGVANGTVFGLAPSAPSTFFVDVGASDGFGGLASNNYTLSVGNIAPSISNPITSDAIHAGRSYERDFNGTDPDGDTLFWSISTNASWLSIGSANGTVWGVAPPAIRSFYANLSVSDGFGGFAGLNYTLSVGNLPPSISTVVANVVLARRAFFSYDLNASDPDVDPLIWSLRTNASFLAMDPGSGTLSGIVSSVPSSYWIEVTVSDGLGGIDSRNFSLAVVNRPPAISVSAPSTGEAGASYSGTFSGTDPDDDTLSWSLTTNATWLLIDAGTGRLYGTPSAGTYFANLSGRDPYGGVAFQNFTITIQGQSTTPPPDGPPGLRSELWTFSLIALLFGVLIAVVMPRRRPIIESAFLIDQTGRVRCEFAIPGTAYDEGRLQSTLRGGSWRGLERVSDPPYTLHIKPDPSGDWIFVSRTSDSDRVTKSGEKLIAKMRGDVTSRKKPRLSERSS